MSTAGIKEEEILKRKKYLKSAGRVIADKYLIKNISKEFDKMTNIIWNVNIHLSLTYAIDEKNSLIFIKN